MRKVYIVAGVFVIVFLLLLKESLKQETWIKETTHESSGKQEKEEAITVTLHRDDAVEIKPLEEYVMGVVAAEMPVSFEMEALKAQSVAARTYVYQRTLEVDDTTASQVYKDEAQLREQWGSAYEENWAKIKTAVEATKGEVLTYDGAYITAAFYSSSCGNTNNAAEYWQKDVPYLRSVPSPWEAELQDNYESEKAVSAAALAETMGTALSSLPAITYYDSGYVEKLCVGELCKSGREIREAFSLRSSSFRIAESEEGFVFITKGSGHGIGMSQYGALGMALEGKNYREILQYYYQGAEISKANV